MIKTAIVHVPRLYKNPSGEIVSDINYCATGLFSLASEIQKEGFSVEIIHLGIEKYLNKNFLLSDYIKENNINFAAFSLHWHKQAYDVIEVIKNVKYKNPNVHISLGGLTASYFADEILEKYNFINSIIKGEGEISIRKLVLALNKNEDLKDIPNLYYRKNGKIVQNKRLYAPSEDEFNSFIFMNSDIMKNFEKYIKAPFILNYSKENELIKNNFYPVSLGRGCLGNCLWCGGGYNAAKKLSGRNFISYRKKEDIIKEIKTLKEKYGLNDFSFSFDPKGKERKEIISLFNSIKKEFKDKINVYYNLDGLPDESFLKAFKGAFSENSTLALSPVFENETLRKKYKSFYYSNDEFEAILNIMEELKINSDIYFSIMPHIFEEENIKSKNYGDCLKSKYKFIKNIMIYPLEFEIASPLFEENINFESYIKEGGIEDSFENTKEFL